jgi:uncharacterized protein YciI
MKDDREGLTVDDILARMARKTLYVVHSSQPSDIDIMRRHLRDHLLYMIDLERQGVLFASGPFSDEEGRQDGSGLTILRADSGAEAERIAARDPMVVAGVRDISIRRWTVNEGAISCTVYFSDSTARVN